MTTADKLLNILMHNLPEDGESDNEIWACPEAWEILCRSKGAAWHLCELLRCLGAKTAYRGYYDPERDMALGTTDGRTGYYVVRIELED